MSGQIAPKLRNHREACLASRRSQLLYEHSLDKVGKVLKHRPRDDFAFRAGAALGLAYAMLDQGEPLRDVRAQAREARAFNLLARGGPGIRRDQQDG